MVRIHDSFSSNWIAPTAPDDLSKLKKRIMDKTRGIKVKIAAIRLISLPERLGKKAIKIAPATGRKIIAVR
jgi:hypothetical protein